VDKNGIAAGLKRPIELVALDEVDSTNDEIKRLAGHGTRGPLAVVAGAQRAGRGRLGRPWSSPPGGVYLSLLVRLDCPLERAMSLPLVVALGVWDAIGMTDVGIKWPNDIVCAAGKLTGILVETHDGAYVIGIGLNVRHPGGDGGWTSPGPNASQPAYLSDLGVNITREAAAAAVINGVIGRMETWGDHEYDFSVLKSEYNSKLSIMGEDVSVRSIDGRIIAQGVVQGVDEGGRLVVLQDGVNVLVTVGDVTLRNP
jgi:BirA family biotin operon repressor/biotin-[acetyl-CoA-carboxylase] ligase